MYNTCTNYHYYYIRLMAFIPGQHR